MQTHAITLPASHYRTLEKVVTALVEKFDTQYIICFGCAEQRKVMTSCFIPPSDQSYARYYLLMITTQTQRMEHQVQDFADSHFPDCHLTLAVHGLESVTKAVNQGSRFFATACQYGMQLYSRSGLRLDLSYHHINPLTTLARAETKYHHHYGLALGFREAAACSFESQHYGICVFMLHQAVEHACNALIRVFTGYRTEMHNLSRLMDHCLIFSDQPDYALPRKTKEDLRLFKLLRDSYSDARYDDKYVVSAADVEILLNRVRELLEVTEELSLQRLVLYGKEAEEAETAINLTTQLNTPMPHAG
ncbi:HEPN domain-containing protein [Mucilaginibacter robiniae]|uniref:HEPN domain-containing protein n=1 Tax=Mucilaginibacter robiniae TaxID=2728022 RepID=A0A7L5E3K7_9SPHI|nr:HEPN domain-containing protein [Mucilaginibacter robiniae]QJD97178.1 HEPN domain-containing protein [Mucilaginibacter robiniae]